MPDIRSITFPLLQSSCCPYWSRDMFDRRLANLRGSSLESPSDRTHVHNGNPILLDTHSSAKHGLDAIFNGILKDCLICTEECIGPQNPTPDIRLASVSLAITHRCSSCRKIFDAAKIKGMLARRHISVLFSRGLSRVKVTSTFLS
jgi:hypothetical protein